ncbi:hypothetical protein TetV_361 [Tetraselmis virus 1]|uniref:Uncharacterized protein n=1 Tax=Tetraselmis virus 1 TaxID=2060617 RepID=A0A2P0VNH5_9VIRU|nr:hypothetical protein QJ968_gp361 [Tetraselmis virus 1]AUF82453.1 hypothetical protein TetV_361 [Tetraselmis virus 1]
MFQHIINAISAIDYLLYHVATTTGTDQFTIVAGFITMFIIVSHRTTILRLLPYAVLSISLSVFPFVLFEKQLAALIVCTITLVSSNAIWYTQYNKLTDRLQNVSSQLKSQSQSQSHYYPKPYGIGVNTVRRIIKEEMKK